MAIWKKLLILALLIGLVACGETSEGEVDDGKLTVVCTTGMIGDAAQNLVGGNVEVFTLMGPGVDPHLYKATQGDLKKLREADLILYNGLHLEGKMGEVLEKLARQKPVIAIGEGVDETALVKAADFADAVDPHIWFDVALWAQAVDFMSQELTKLDPDHAADYQARTSAYLAELDSLDQVVETQLASIPQAQRVLITAHDAFTYFGLAYDVEVRGLQGISTLSEYGLRDISDLVRFITDRNIKAVFVESSVPSKSLEAVVEGCAQQGHEVQIGGTLYSDAMGPKGSPEGTYIGMVHHYVQSMVRALR
ncbi:MAG: zinc ABC transporter substrate-binding protein [Bacteroidota bacterium]